MQQDKLHSSFHQVFALAAVCSCATHPSDWETWRNVDALHPCLSPGNLELYASLAPGLPCTLALRRPYKGHLRLCHAPLDRLHPGSAVPPPD